MDVDRGILSFSVVVCSNSFTVRCEVVEIPRIIEVEEKLNIRLVRQTNRIAPLSMRRDLK